MFNKGRSILSAILVGKTTMHGCFKMDLVKKSEYILQLSSVSRQRYIEKLTKVGLSNDPYCLESPEWEKGSGKFTFTVMMMFMVSTPSPYTKESIKVVQQFFLL